MNAYVGDFNKNDVVRLLFNTRKGDGTPITLAGTPAAKVYEDSNTTEFTGGVTLTVAFDSVVGLHEIKCDTSNAAYSIGHDYTVILTAGTVDGVSVVGATLMKFSIENRSDDVAGLANMISMLETPGGGVYRLKLNSLANVLGLVFENTDTLEGYLRLSSAVLYRKAVGLNTSSPIFYAEDDTTPRVSDTITSGTRITVLDPS